MSLRAVLLAALLVAPLAGCLEGREQEGVTGAAGGEGAADDNATSGADQSGAANWRVGGRFHENATQQDLEALRAELEPYGADMAVMESFPMQYAIDGLTVEACSDVREILAAKPFVATVSECQPLVERDDPDAPTSEPAGPAATQPASP